MADVADSRSKDELPPRALIDAPWPTNWSSTPCQPKNSASVTTNDGMPTLATRNPVNTPIDVPRHIARQDRDQRVVAQMGEPDHQAHGDSTAAGQIRYTAAPISVTSISSAVR